MFPYVRGRAVAFEISLQVSAGPTILTRLASTVIYIVLAMNTFKARQAFADVLREHVTSAGLASWLTGAIILTWVWMAGPSLSLIAGFSRKAIRADADEWCSSPGHTGSTITTHVHLTVVTVHRED